ncbi:hypothetical protein [Lysobacter sp. FW306-1B-D06B]|uniref:hypothetical protein n=1 Tax=Lysobacter sp. FW306-1B-D06B TaxID=3140250 RepID=UPI003140150B
MKARPQLALLACLAARRFVRRRPARTPGRAWLPLLLRYRRVHASTAARIGMRSRVMGMQIHVHLGFAHHARQMGGQMTSPALSSAAVNGRSSSMTLRSSQMTPARALYSSPVENTLAPVGRAGARRARMDHPLRPHRAANPMALPDARQRAQAPTVGARVVAALRVQAARTPLPVHGGGGIEAQDQRLSAVAMRARASRASSPNTQGARHAMSPSQSMGGSPDLIWRAPPPAAVPASVQTLAQSPYPTTDETTRPTAFEPIEPADLAPQVRAAMRAQVLDPAIVDRLADDVIRRIDRRARIERERRGL